MRTAVSNAASLHRLHWQAAFALKTYQTSSPVFWQHVFVSDTPMTNWSGGSSLFLNWAAESGSFFLEDESAAHPELSSLACLFSYPPLRSEPGLAPERVVPSRRELLRV